MLRTILIVCAMFVAVGTANAGPLKLTDTQMDNVTAGDLTTHGNKVFVGFDNPAPGDFHPTLLKGVATDGPWQAHFNSPTNKNFPDGVIQCLDC